MVIAYDHRIVDINDNLLNKIGLPRDQVIGGLCYEITHHQKLPCSGDDHPCPLIQTLETRKPSQMTHVHLDKDKKEIYYSISTYPLFEEGEVIGAVEISRDITKEINLQKSMMQQEKLASIGRLSAGVAHEVNNPLTTILTTAMLIQEDIQPDNPIYQELETISKEALRCRKIVTSLLDFARQTTPTKRECDINEIVQESLVLTRKQAAFTDLALTCKLAEDLPRLYLDKGQIQQAVINLVINAIEATLPGGSISISTAYHPDQGIVSVTVSDTGKGMSEDELGKIFDPFFTTKETGSGLGLAVTHGIIEQHDGDISVYSRIGFGTSFQIALPVASEKKDASG
jgi:signal transduction histidine kinase